MQKTDRCKMIDRSSRENLLSTTAYGIEQRVGGGRYVEAVVQAIKIVYDLYKLVSDFTAKSKKAQALAEISTQLATIITQLNEINSRLDEIFGKLDEIEDKVDQLPFRTAAIDNAGARTTIAENFQHWSSDAATTDDLRDARDAKTRLARNNRILMTGRKMAYIYDVLLSYAFELNLDILLDTPDTTLEAATTNVLTYLESARDPAIEGSIAFYLAASEPVYEALLKEEGRLDREDYVGSPVRNKHETKFGGVRCTYDQFRVVVGSLKGRDLALSNEYRNERSCYAYDQIGPPRQMQGSDRAVPTQSHVQKMLERFIPHADVVEFTTEALVNINSAISDLRCRLKKQLEIEG